MIRMRLAWRQGKLPRVAGVENLAFSSLGHGTNHRVDQGHDSVGFGIGEYPAT